MAETGSYCTVIDKCIYSAMDECMGIEHQNCPTKQNIVDGSWDEAAIQRIKSGFTNNKKE